MRYPPTFKLKPVSPATCACCSRPHAVDRCPDCTACKPGAYKEETGNVKCTDCLSSSLPLAAKVHTTTERVGATNATECVCKEEYFLVKDPVSSVASCLPCSGTWFQGRAGTDCSRPGITLETLPVLPGFYRQSRQAQVVRKCINIDANAACLGNMGNRSASEAVPAVTKSMLLDISIDEFTDQREALIQALASAYGVPPSQITLETTAGSLQLTITISTGATATSVVRLMAGVNSIDDSTLTIALGNALGTGPINVTTTTAPQQTMIAQSNPKGFASSCAPGYGGPYCAVCSLGFHGGGEGGVCMDCDDAGDPTLTIALQLGGAFAALVIGAFVMIKFGRKVLTFATNTLENSSSVASLQASVKMQAKEAVVANVKLGLSTGAQISRTPGMLKFYLGILGKLFSALVKLVGVVKRMGVEIKILISLYQVLTGLGLVFSIPYPESYTQWLDKVDSININLPSLLPLDCLFGGINYMHVLLLQTAGPLVVIFILECLGRYFHKLASKQAIKAATSIPPPAEVVTKEMPPLAPMLAELCTDVSFFLLFLLCKR